MPSQTTASSFSISRSHPVLLALLLISLHGSTLLSQTHNWTRTNPGGGGAIAVVGATASGTILAASDLSGIYRSFDDGQSWDVVGANQGLLETHISALGFHPTDGNTYFAGTYIGAYKTTDGGESFQKVFPLASNGFDYSYIESIVLAASDSTRGYITHHPGPESFGEVYRSIDGGNSWQAIPSTDFPDSLRLVKLMVHPVDENLVYLLTGKTRWGCSPARLYRSSDGGVHWTMIGTDLGDILDMDLHPTDPDLVFVSTFESTYVDSESCRETNIEDYYVDDENAGAFFKSTNRGNSFTLLTDKTGIISVGTIDPGIIRLVNPLFPYDWNDNAGTWESPNAGLTWTHTGFVENWSKGYTTNQYFAFSKSFNGLNKTISRDLFNSDRFFASFGQWAWGSFDGGQTLNNISTVYISPNHWLSTGVENINGHCLEISESNPDIIFTGAYDSGFWYSTDHGGSWTRSLPNYNLYPEYVWNLGEGPVEANQAVREAGSNVSTILSDPVRDHVVWATFSKEQYTSLFNSTEAIAGLFRSNEHGENWQLVEGGMPTGSAAVMMYGLSLDINSPVDNRTLFMTIKGDIYRSQDDGVSWSMVFANGGLKFTEVDHFNGDIVYAGGRNGIFRSTDGGDIWQDLEHAELGSVHENIRVDIVPTWTEWGLDEPLFPWEGVFDIQADPNIPMRVYATVLGPGKGLYRSDDAGIYWSKLLTDLHMRGVAIAPQNSQIIYATSSQSYHSGGLGNSLGVQYSTDAGSTWADANDGMAWSYGGTIKVSTGDDPHVWAWSPGTGVQMAPVPALSTTPAIDIISPSTLRQNYPNPFNPSTTIAYSVSRSGFVTVKVFDLSGHEIETLVSESQAAGTYVVQFDAGQVASGLYFVELRDGSGAVETKKMTLLK